MSIYEIYLSHIIGLDTERQGYITVLFRKLTIPEAAQELAEENKFELEGYLIDAAQESIRPPRIVRIGLIQNKIVLPTTAPLTDQVCVMVFSVYLTQSWNYCQM